MSGKRLWISRWIQFWFFLCFFFLYSCSFISPTVVCDYNDLLFNYFRSMIPYEKFFAFFLDLKWASAKECVWGILIWWELSDFFFSSLKKKKKVCRQWRDIAEKPELWSFLLQRDGWDEEREKRYLSFRGLSPKELYGRLYRGRGR